MKLKRTIYFLTFIAILFLLSCTNLDEETFDRVTADQFFQTDEEVLSNLMQAYTGLYDFMAGPFSMLELSSDELVLPVRDNDWYDGGNWIRMHQHRYTPDDQLVREGWQSFYHGANLCNKLIYQFEQLNPPGIDKFIAELRVLRALFYYWLLDTYGNVPIITQYDIPKDFAPANK